MRKKYINRSLIISLVAIGATIVLLATIRSIYSGVAGAQTPITTEATQNSQLARRVKGGVYYDVSFSTDQVSRGKEKRFNITVTAISNQTGLVDKNPFQRVKLTALPISITKTKYGEEWTSPGTFTSVSSNRPSIYAEDTFSYDVGTSSGTWPISSFDLINGMATISFSLTKTPSSDNYIGFMVTPTTWYKAPGLQSANAYRLNLQAPRRPNNYTFLYKEWQTDDVMATHVFTVATLPIDKALHQGMIELGNWQPETKLPDYQPQNDVAQNVVVPPAANLTQPTYDETTSARSRLSFWLWLTGSLIALSVMGLGWLALKRRSHRTK